MKLGDLFAKLAQGQQLSSGEIEQLRLGMNRQQGLTSQLSALLTPSGDLDPNIFSHHSSEFSMLPHQTASMFRSAENQSIPDETATTITYELDSAHDADEKRLSWAFGIERDIANGEFLLKGVPNKTVWLFSYYVFWAGAGPTAEIQIGIVEKDTATGLNHTYDDAASIGNVQSGAVMMKARKAASSWTLRAYHNSAGAINISNALFQVARIR